MRYSQLRAFDAVARGESFTKAATLLGVTQPAVTLQVRALEDAYGLRLLKRAGPNVSLTAEGRRLFALTRRMFAVEDEIGAFLSASKDLEAGDLLLGADGPHVALDLVSAMTARHPRLSLRLTLGNAEQTWQALLEQRVDAAVLANPPRDSRVVVTTLSRQDMMALLPRDHPLAGRRSIKLTDLEDQPTILREAGSNTQQTLKRALARHRVTLEPALELGSREAVREAVARGLGIGFLFRLEAIGDDRTVAVPIREMTQSSRDTLICLKSQSRRAAVAALFAAGRALAAGRA